MAILSLALVPIGVAADLTPDMNGPYWEVDASFNPALEWVGDSYVSAWAYPGGKILISSGYRIVNGVRRNGWLSRLNPDGQIDPGFQVSASVGILLAVYPDGRVLHAVHPDFSVNRLLVKRMLANGADDETFHTSVVYPNELHALLLSNGDILLHGSFGTDGNVTRRNLVRLHADGTLDEGFQSPLPATDSSHGAAFALEQTDGKLAIAGDLGLGGGHSKLARLNADGSLDDSFSTGSFTFSGAIVALYLESDGRLVTAHGGHLYRFDLMGTNDAAFSPVLAGDPQVFSPRLTDGKIFYTSRNGSQVELRRLNPDFTPDLSFAPVITVGDIRYSVGVPVVTDDGALYVGPLTAESYWGRFALTRLTSTGAIDPSFQPRFSRDVAPSAQLVQADGKILVAGRFDHVNGSALSEEVALIRLNADGTTDGAFAPVLPNGSWISKLAPAAGGKVLAFGSFPREGASSATVRRFEASGATDASFTEITTEVAAAAWDAEGRIYVRNNQSLVRFLSNGQPDSGFVAPSLSGIVKDIVPMAGGKILVSTLGGFSNFAVVRLLADGSLDPVQPEIRGNNLLTLVPLANGDLLVAETESGGDYSLRVRVRRFSASLDAMEEQFSYRTIPAFSNYVSEAVQLAFAGFVSDQLRAAAGDTPASARVEASGQPFAAVFQCWTDQNLYLIQDSGRLARYVRSGTGGASFDPAPHITSWTSSPTSYPQNRRLTLTVTPDGLAPFEYQWSKNGVPIDGAIESNLSLGVLEVADTGEYTVQVKNSFGSAVSPVRVVNVDPDYAVPYFAGSLANEFAAPGSTVVFDPQVRGTQPITLQWYFNNSPMVGETGSVLQLTNVGPENSGSYQVFARGPRGEQVGISLSLVVGGQLAPEFTSAAIGFLGLDYFATTTAGHGQVEWAFGAGGYPAGTSLSPESGQIIFGDTGTLSVKARFLGDANFGPSDWSADFAITVLPIPATFNWQVYLQGNPDVAASVTTAAGAWNHYYHHGIFEGRTDGDFDVQAYLAKYPALAALFGTDLRAAAMHWYTVGRQLGLRVPAGFDVAGYLARNADIAALFSQDKYGAWLHYYNYGLFEGRSFDANFIPAEYLELNTDLKTVFGSNLQAAVMHWFNYGHPIEDRMGRVPIGFNVDSYLARYPDLSAVFGGITPTAVRNVTVWHHYLAYGTLEGRSDGDFEAYHYLATNPDLNAIFGTDIQAAALHWYFYGRREGRRIPGGFTVQNYRSLYPDVVLVFGDDLYGSWIHYRDNGVFEGRVYDDLFRPADYLSLNPDVAAAIGTNYRDALLHWLYYGQYEGRQAKQ